jgi:hypothetical protein
MAITIKDLLQKNKNAHKQHFYIESVYLSYNLMSKVLRRFVIEEKLTAEHPKAKLSDYIKAIRPQYENSPAFGKKLKKAAFKAICDFNSDFKSLNKELKYQYPEVKLKHASQKGINALVQLNTSIVKLKNNRGS